MPKILCVDDESDVLDALTRLLRHDFTVLKAESAEEGLRILDQFPDISIILTDYSLSGISGRAFLQQAKRKSPETVRAIISGRIDIKEMSDSINREEIHRFILKPWDNQYLLIQMKEALLSHSILQEKNRLHHLAITDPITGLTNHRYFQEALKKEWKQNQKLGQCLSLLMLDIDHFKACNDLYGHLVGDQILAEVARRMEAHKRAIDVLSRYGGEEFALILPNTTLSQAQLRAEMIAQGIATKSFHLGDRLQHSLTLSIGIATQSTHGEYLNPSALIAAADSALYQSKHQGRNKIILANPTLDRN